MSGIHQKYHDFIVKTIIQHIKPELGAKVCRTIGSMTGEQTKLQPDIFVEAKRETLDFTLRVNVHAGYQEKIKKYKGKLEKDVIPIAASPFGEIHKQSLDYLLKNTKKPK